MFMNTSRLLASHTYKPSLHHFEARRNCGVLQSRVQAALGSRQDERVRLQSFDRAVKSNNARSYTVPHAAGSPQPGFVTIAVWAGCGSLLCHGFIKS